MTMLVEYLDSFDYDEADLLLRGWTKNDTGNELSMNTTTPITGYASVSCIVGANITNLQRGFSGNYASLSMRLRTRIDRSTANGEALFGTMDAGTVALQVSCLTSTGTLTVRLGGATTLITATDALIDDGIHDIELIFLIDNSVGTAELFVDGVSVGTFSGDTQVGANAYVNEMFIGQLATATFTWGFDDLRIYRPSTGSATQMGASRVFRKDVTSDTAQEDFTPSTGSDSYAMLDEQSSDGDTTYVESATDGHKTRMTGEAVDGTVGVVLGAQAVAVARKTDGASRDILVGATDSGGSNEEKSGAQALTSAFAAYYHGFEDVPGGTGLVASDISALELLIEANQ